MRMKRIAYIYLSLFLHSVCSLAFTGKPFAIQSSRTISGARTPTHTALRMSTADDAFHHLDRRSMLLSSMVLPAAVFSTKPFPAAADDDTTPSKSKKIVVVGGAGWVGAHVDELLLDKGYDVLVVSRSSPSSQAEKVKVILGKSLSGSIEYQSLDASTDDLSGALSGASAVISCVGALPGSSNQRAGNGAVNVRIADAAKAAGIDKFVYISVASDLANSPAKFLLGDYFKGKAEAEAAVLKDFGATNSLIVKPAIIEGGPPGEIRPPGPPGYAPVSSEAVAKVAVSGAIGDLKGSIDGNTAIVTTAASAS